MRWGRSLRWSSLATGGRWPRVAPSSRRPSRPSAASGSLGSFRLMVLAGGALTGRNVAPRRWQSHAHADKPCPFRSRRRQTWRGRSGWRCRQGGERWRRAPGRLVSLVGPCAALLPRQPGCLRPLTQRIPAGPQPPQAGPRAEEPQGYAASHHRIPLMLRIVPPRPRRRDRARPRSSTAPDFCAPHPSSTPW
jgi:hypothetical protein